MNWEAEVEKERIHYEQPLSSTGLAVLPEQVWRDTPYIPSTCPVVDFEIKEERGIKWKIGVYKTKIGEEILPVIEKIEGLPLKQVVGTDGSFYHEKLIDILHPNFDVSTNSYKHIIYIDNKPLAYGKGIPIFIVHAGVLRFDDKDFVEKIKGKQVTIDFVRYAGRKGVFDDKDFWEKFPIRDNVKLIRSAKDDDKTMLFEVGSKSKGHSIYIFPEMNKGYLKNTNKKKNVVMTQENMNSVLWNIGVVDGGLHL